MIRRLMVAFAAVAMMGAVGCSGGEKKADEAPAEQPESAPMEEVEAPAEEEVEAPDEEAPADEGMDEEEGDE